jgi:hypothetical protein
MSYSQLKKLSVLFDVIPGVLCYPFLRYGNLTSKDINVLDVHLEKKINNETFVQVAMKCLSELLTLNLFAVWIKL